MNQQTKHKILCVSVMESWGGGELFLLNLIKGNKDFDFVIGMVQGIQIRNHKAYVSHRKRKLCEEVDRE